MLALISIIIGIIILIALVFFVIRISSRKIQRIEAKPKLRSALLVILCVLSVYQFAGIIGMVYDTLAEKTTEQVIENHYKSIAKAWNDHDIYLGMTFDEITDICGYPDWGVNRTNGEIRAATWMSNGYGHLTFRNGRLVECSY